MSSPKSILFLFIVIFITVMIGCSGDNTRTEDSHESGSLTANRNEYSRDSSEKSEGDGEESGTEYSLTDKYDKVRNGARLILVFDAQSNSFKGTVENVTSKTLKRVRVEVHLSNGIELGPTTAANLGSGEKIDVVLPATEKKFEKWSAHPEVGGGEHGHEGEEGEHGGEREHDRAGSGEHE